MIQSQLNIGEMIFHHTADAWTLDFYPLGVIHLPHWHDVQLAGLTLNFSPTKHVVFMIVAAILVFITMKVTANGLRRQQAGQNAPKGFANAIEGVVLYVRDEMALANIGHGGEKFVPLIISLFFFVLYCNLMGLFPWGSTPTGNLAVTAALAILVFLTVEIGGLVKLGPRGYWSSIYPHFEGMHGPGAVFMSTFMMPIEILGKVVKPVALAVRLFGNMTAGHFVILAMLGLVFLFGTLGAASWVIALTTVVVVTGVMLLELFVAFLQAYVFALLSAVFIGLMQHEH
ncbi:MAG: F0F1 ATP synthase subunit A [Gemmatimonadota bacterium]